MQEKRKRITVSIPLEKEEEIASLKKECFKDKSNSELFRYLLKAGLQASDRQGAETNRRK